MFDEKKKPDRRLAIVSDIVWTPIRYVTLHFRDRYRNRVEITVIVGLCVSLSPIRYHDGLRASAKAIWYNVNVALI